MKATQNNMHIVLTIIIGTHGTIATHTRFNEECKLAVRKVGHLNIKTTRRHAF